MTKRVNNLGDGLVALMVETEAFLCSQHPDHPLVSLWSLYFEGSLTDAAEEDFVKQMNDYLSAKKRKKKKKKV